MGVNKDQKARRKNAVGIARNRANEEAPLPADSEGPVRALSKTETTETAEEPPVVVAETTEELTDG